MLLSAAARKRDGIDVVICGLNVPLLQKICDEEGVQLADLGEFGTEDHTLKLSYAGHHVGQMSMHFLH